MKYRDKDGKEQTFFLDPAVKAKWVAALRSGEYKQGSHQLYDPKTKGYCCLGLKCHIEGNLIERPTGATLKTTKTTSLYTSWVDKRKGQTADISYISADDIPLPIQKKLAEYNDGYDEFGNLTIKRSFTWIAAYIERYL